MVIPHNAKKVFNGILFDVYQWKQKMFDNSIKTFEMLKRKSSLQGEIDLIHQSTKIVRASKSLG